MFYTVKDLNDILKGELIVNKGHENNIIDDFEYIYGLVSNTHTAFISIPKNRWAELLGRSSNLKDGNSYINFTKQSPGLIITEVIIDNIEVPQIIVNNSVDALKTLGLYMREQYKNPLLAITGSNGKSSTRIMISHLLSDYKVFQNRGNNNTRSATWLNLCKLIKKPDYAIFEISLNALNNKGNMSLVVKPDIAILTNIGEAHLSSLKNTKKIAEFKSRLFKGVSREGTIILNYDTLHYEFLYNQALKSTNKIISYSAKNSNTEINYITTTEGKNHQKVNLKLMGEKYTYLLNILGQGMVENSIASLLALKVLNININSILHKFNNYKSLPKVMETNNITNKNNQNITVIDDTHNASLPSYINAIESFNQQSKFYKGNKILVLGKISDMGEETISIHNKLVSLLEESEADYILCIDEPMRQVSVKVKSKKIIWYMDDVLLLKDILYFISDDSLILFKSSVTDSALPAIARQFPLRYRNSSYKFQDDIYKTLANNGKSELLMNKINKEVIFSENINNSGTIEGLNVLIYYIRYKKLLNENKLNKSEVVHFSKWPTNDKEYNEETKMTIEELVDKIQQEAHPSLVYELSKKIFESPIDRVKYIDVFLKENNLSVSASVNRTGRFRSKERQSFTVRDLCTIAEKNKSIFEENAFIFGDRYYHGIVMKDNMIGCFTSYKTIGQVMGFIEKANKGESFNEFTTS